MSAAAAAFLLLQLLLLNQTNITPTNAHGYLSSPRSRNYVAFQDRLWSEEDAMGSLTPVPWPEDCPHCLNRGGVLAQCGLHEVLEAGTGLTITRNYDIPKNYKGEPMPPNIQATYTEGDIIDVEVLVTTHHKGHFVFSACPVVATPSNVDIPVNQNPTQECFDNYKLTLVEDTLYNANIDKRFPERIYLAPASKLDWKNEGPTIQPVTGAKYKFKLQLPQGLHGEVVLLQWYYLTANSCKHVGYDGYTWPEEWGGDVLLYERLPDCENVPVDGDGVPEQFWNCAEVKITPLKPVEQDSPKEEFKQCADSSYSYYEATEDCTGYVYCMSGGSIDGPYECGTGQLYDSDSQRCNWEDKVFSCGSKEQAEPGVPTPLPTPKPTAKNALLDWEPVPRPHDKVIIGYYASWQWYDRDGLAAPINMDFSKITRANFAFFQITEEGEIYGTDSWADPITLFGPYDWMAEDGFQYCSWDEPGAPPKCGYHFYNEGLIYLSHQAGTEVYPSIGGWTLSDPFPPMAANAKARKNFADNCVKLIKEYNFDGIDLDWEYPGYADHSGTPDDTVNFNLLLDDVRAALDELGEETGRFYGLTAALPCGPSLIGNQDVAHVSSVLTELNLMTYDLHGAWNAETGVNAPLYDQKDSPELSVHGCVKNWEAGGAPPEKINVGFPFYGRSFIGATGLYQPHSGVDDATWHQDEGVPQYYNIYNLLSTMVQNRDDQTMTQIAYFHTGNMVSYDDERAICDKTEYAMDNGHLGYIIWELSGDMLDDGSTPLLDAANAKLANPSIDCADMGNGVSASYLIAEAGGEAAGEVAADKPKFYPHFDSSTCLSDGLQPSWLQATDISDNPNDCCRNNFPWNTDCVAQSTAIEGDIFYPASGSYSCKSDGKQPVYMAKDDLFNTEEDCCKYHFSWVAVEDCISNGKATTTTTTTSSTTTSTTTTTTTSRAATTTKSTATTGTTTTKATAGQMVPAETTTTKATVGQMVPAEATADQPVLYDQSTLFFPLFENGITKCQNEGTPTSWLSVNDFKSTLDECCRSYASNYDDCMTASYETDLRYYPDFQKMKCISEEDGTPGNWMSDDYFRWNEKRCCKTFFASSRSSSCSKLL